MFKVFNILILYSLSKVSGTSVTGHVNGNSGKCLGKHNIPLDEKIAVQKFDYKPIQLREFAKLPESITVENTGRTLVMTMNYTEPVPYIAMGPFGDIGVFRFDHLYFHWIDLNIPRSTFNNYELVAELHVVFYNSKYKNLHEAASGENGIGIMAYIVEIDRVFITVYNLFEDQLINIREPSTRIQVPDAKRGYLYTYISDDIGQYLTYRGSWESSALCVNNVIWIDIPTPVAIPASFRDELQLLRGHNNKSLMSDIIDIKPPTGPILEPENPIREDDEEFHSSIPFVDAYADYPEVGGYAGGTHSNNLADMAIIYSILLCQLLHVGIYELT